MSGGIYLIHCIPNDTWYVGSAKNFKNRFCAHLGELFGGKHRNSHMQHSFNKYGKEAFQFIEYLRLGEYNKNEYFSEENKVIEEFRQNGRKLFNIAKAEGGWTYATEKRKHEIAEKISNSLKAANSILSDEERSEKYGKGKKGIPLTDDRRATLSNFWKGKEKSPETKKRMSEAQKGTAHTKENGRKVGKSNIGKKPPNMRRVMVDGIEFNSLKEAADHFKITSSAIHKRIKRNKNGKNGYID